MNSLYEKSNSFFSNILKILGDLVFSIIIAGGFGIIIGLIVKLGHHFLSGETYPHSKLSLPVKEFLAKYSVVDVATLTIIVGGVIQIIALIMVVISLFEIEKDNNRNSGSISFFVLIWNMLITFIALMLAFIVPFLLVGGGYVFMGRIIGAVLGFILATIIYAEDIKKDEKKYRGLFPKIRYIIILICGLGLLGAAVGQIVALVIRAILITEI
jgi:hypothetical protein